MLRTQVAMVMAITSLSPIARVASAQTPPPAIAAPVPPRPLHLELAPLQGVTLKIRHHPGDGVTVGNFMSCPPSCRLIVSPGPYQLQAESPSDSGLRDVATTVDLTDDARIEVAPGSRSEHGWGLGLTIGGSVLFALGVVFGFAQEAGANSDKGIGVEALALMGAGAPVTAGGIYLFVRARNRVTVEGAWQRSMVPAPPPAQSHLDVGWRF